ncbi:Tubulin/FtsZ family, GTPase domain [Halogeometricum rufum]|uniref:Tubulin/FtsZ family, GTPase domain n=1 Tax=Halogeometricum rufum TaxID=553469 RepID=A0A1I6GU86_9EURY|nr:cell division protein FtsZ [Halogeometricum rufum]SFR45686.1 Tubulin/FtsZ family, GTPase domain [Halogeometricum rufum]
MTERCKICYRTAAEWETNTLDEHLANAHRDDPMSVKAVYAEAHDRLFDDDGVVDADVGGGDDDEAQTDEEADETADERTAPDLADTTYGKKWYVIGVGGAGNNIVDAILLRRRTLDERDADRAYIWQGGLAGYGMLNTNISELEQTYYASEVKQYVRNDLLSNTLIGMGGHDGTGMGYRWDTGAKVVEYDFEGEKNAFRDRWDLRPQEIRDSQAVMFVHSVTKGTGCGSTPVLAEKLREHVLPDDTIVGKPVLSSVVLPSQGSELSRQGGRPKTNGVVGLARLSQAVDAVIPFTNDRLERAEGDIHPEIADLTKYNPPQYASLNRPLVAYLEAFTLTSTPQLLSQEHDIRAKGDVFDVSDSFRPAQDKYPASIPLDETPAVVLAPVLGRLRGSEMTESSLDLLVRNTLLQNKLADFDPSTAWGGQFLVYGPDSKMERIRRHVTDGTMQEILNREEFLDGANTDSVETVDVQINQLSVPYLDDVYLWGALWNPEMPALESMYEHARDIKEGGSRQGESLREVWPHVESLFDCLGRENMA